MDTENMTKLILYAVAMAMGVATIVLSAMGQSANIGVLIGIAVFCLALAGLNSVDTDSL